MGSNDVGIFAGLDVHAGYAIAAFNGQAGRGNVVKMHSPAGCHLPCSWRQVLSYQIHGGGAIAVHDYQLVTAAGFPHPH